MKCPVDDVTLVMSERSGVEIDYCPTCRGVWLDRGELDKILDRMAANPLPPAAPASPSAPAASPLLPPPLLNNYGRSERTERTERPDRPDRYDPRETRRDDYNQQGKYGNRRPKKKKDWLSEMFDF